MKTFELINANECTGCKLCEFVCPTKAIFFKEEELGALVPAIDEKKCVNCNMCKKYCPNNKSLYNIFQKIYAAVNPDEEYLAKSSSGGVFSSIAFDVLKKGGVVYGAAMLQNNSKILEVKHIRITDIKDLPLLQGSKYVQSNMDEIYSKIKKDIESELTVVFSGTPCQVAAVKSLIGDANNLLLIDVICHGIPSQKMFTDYLKILNKKNIVNFIFRNKKDNVLSANLVTKHKNKVKISKIYCLHSSYYKMFLNCESFRKSCYECKYANQKRVSDLTIGDYWGIEQDDKTYNLLKEMNIDLKKGVSCVLVNSEKGLKYVNNSNLNIIESTFESVANKNGQLKQPVKMPDTRKKIVQLYDKGNYKNIELYLKRKLGIKKYYFLFVNSIPSKFKNILKNIIRK